MDEETAHFIELRKAKRERLMVLDKQAARYGIDTPPHIELERISLRDELGMVETAIKTPARPDISEELGSGGRFLVYYQQNREIKQSIAAVAVQLEAFIAQSLEWRSMHRQWLLIIGVVVVFILVAVVAIVSYLFARGAL